ncbi:MAG TPA: crossover junction endodeoxyribonuclease RuvC [bacterium]|nr:crossover junction endodeoxyribonuclease RuvC [bacterium]
MSYRILGIDPGSHLTGWAVLDLPSFGKNIDLISCGVIDVGKSEFPHNLNKIFEELKGIIEEYHPGFMSIESVFSGVNPASLIKLTQARGVICLLSSVYDLRLREYSPRFVKKGITGYGNSSKHQVKDALKFFLSLKNNEVTSFLDNDILDNNMSDAIAIAVCCATDMGSFIKN